MRISTLSIATFFLCAAVSAQGPQPGEVLSWQKVSDTAGGFTGVLGGSDIFGRCIAGLGDLDGDGVRDMVVGADNDDDGGTNRGALWILFLNSDGTVKSHQKISSTAGGFTGTLNNQDHFGFSVDSLGDLDGDGVVDLAVGAWMDDDGGVDQGAVWILFLNSDGTVKAHQKISETQGGFTGTLDPSDFLGYALESPGDLDGNGTNDLVVGALFDDDGGTNRGAVWVLFLGTDGMVTSHQKISATQGGFAGPLLNSDYFGTAIAPLGDFDGDGTIDIAVCAEGDDDGGGDRGAVWILLLNSDATVKSHQKISATTGGFTGALDYQDWFGESAEFMGDLDGDGIGDLAVGATNDDDGGSNTGAVWMLFLNADGTVKQHAKITEFQGGFNQALDSFDIFAFSLANLGDIDGDGNVDLAVSAIEDDDGGSNHGSVYVLFLNSVVLDSDNDGLTNPEELALGTDPYDADSDDDGLYDGTEVNDTGTDPLDADSDDDGLLDGWEIDQTGTDPLNPDTDGDGVGDATDPLPTVPGVTTGYVENACRDLADSTLDLDLGLFNGPNNNANKGRRNSLANRAANAANAIAQGDAQSAIDLLNSLLDKIDGQSKPKDWMDESQDQAEMAGTTSLLIALLAYN